jgi:hypothetical protein
LPGLDRRSGRAAPAPPPGWRRRGILILVAILSILAGIGISRTELEAWPIAHSLAITGTWASGAEEKPSGQAWELVLVFRAHLKPHVCRVNHGRGNCHKDP